MDRLKEVIRDPLVSEHRGGFFRLQLHMMKSPNVVYRKDKATGRWTLQVSDWRAFLDAAGADVVAAFAACLVHADRLTSLVGLTHYSAPHYESGSVPRMRDLHTVVWFAVGTLREFAMASRSLRGALVRRGCNSFKREPWPQIIAIEKRWQDDDFYRQLRNKVAFHVDPKSIRLGIEWMSSSSPVVIGEGKGRKIRETSWHLGIDALLVGALSENGAVDLEHSQQEFGRFVDSFNEHLGEPANLIAKALMLFLEHANLEPTYVPAGSEETVLPSADSAG